MASNLSSSVIFSKSLSFGSFALQNAATGSSSSSSVFVLFSKILLFSIDVSNLLSDRFETPVMTTSSSSSFSSS
jgi:hypothetical protein